jgi:hypothetical protein
MFENSFLAAANTAGDVIPAPPFGPASTVYGTIRIQNTADASSANATDEWPDWLNNIGTIDNGGGGTSTTTLLYSSTDDSIATNYPDTGYTEATDFTAYADGDDNVEWLTAATYPAVGDYYFMQMRLFAHDNQYGEKWHHALTLGVVRSSGTARSSTTSWNVADVLLI